MGTENLIITEDSCLFLMSIQFEWTVIILVRVYTVFVSFIFCDLVLLHYFLITEWGILGCSFGVCLLGN
jgi:hypothetical protein